jgi:hypothetical protein
MYKNALAISSVQNDEQSDVMNYSRVRGQLFLFWLKRLPLFFGEQLTQMAEFTCAL